MAVFDLRKQRMCIRIVYDGLGGAGKTTNLRQLAALFAAQRTTELYSPAEIDGRTLYFDWMQINGGVVCGFPLLCQVISVPGQVVLTERRRHLLSTADAVVYVSDSARSAVPAAREGLDVLTDVLRQRATAPTFVVQANKQDQAEALQGRELVSAFGLEDITCVEAIARDGIGVVDTFVAAVRSVARNLQESFDGSRGSFRIPVRPAESPAAVLEKLQGLEVDPEWAAEMCLEEAVAAMLAEGPAPAAFDLGDLTAERAEVEEAATPKKAAPGPRRVPFPRADLPTGYVWPAHTGRTHLNALAEVAETAEMVKVGRDGCAQTEACGFRLTTTTSARFTDPEVARRAIVRAARERTQLEGLLAPETVLALQPEDETTSWLWTIAPALPMLDPWLRELESERRPRLERFAAAVADALGYTIRTGVALDTSTASFGVDAGIIRYLGPLAPAVEDTGPTMVATAIAAVPASDAHVFTETLERELARRALSPTSTSAFRTEPSEKLSPAGAAPHEHDAR